jgi:hypothetical protein
MRSKNFIIADRCLESLVGSIFSIAAVILFSCGIGLPQRLAILTPDERPLSRDTAVAIKSALSDRFRIEDLDLARSAAATVKVESPYNLQTSEAKSIGAVVGAPYFILIQTGELRRTSSTVEQYYEAYAAIYIVHSSSGMLTDWKLFSVTGSLPGDASCKLEGQTGNMTDEIVGSIRRSESEIRSKIATTRFPPVPEGSASDPNGLKLPMPYRRIRPEYTSEANLYSVKATVEIEADIDAEGRIVNTEIVRWAGFGLDESVNETVRKMNWRPATIGNRTLPMRVLLRYNFVKIDKDEDR